MERNKSLEKKLSHAAERLHKKDDAYERAENRDFYITLLIIIVAVFAIRAFIFEPLMVSGPSMYPTLHDSERMLVEKVSYWFTTPKRGDIIICHYPESFYTWSSSAKPGDTYVKRVIGEPGDTVQIVDGKIYINGELLDESAYWEGYIGGAGLAESGYVVPKDSVFVMGDNRNNSSDSRSSKVGAIKLTEVIGKVHYVIWPFDSARNVYSEVDNER